MNRKGSHRQTSQRSEQLKLELGRERYERLRRDSLRTIRAHDRHHGTKYAPMLRPEHRVALRFSTSGKEADRISQALRESPNEAVMRYAGLVAAYNSALDRLPPHCGVVWRGLHFEGRGGRERLEDFLSRYEEGNTVAHTGFTHASKDKDIAKGMALGGVTDGVLTVIESRQGRDVAPWSMYPHEAEVAFKLGARFKVDKADKVGSMHVIVLIDTKED